MYEFNVQSMSCGCCAGRVTRAVKELDPQAKVEIDVSGKKVLVETTQERAAVMSALAEAGYPAK